MESKLVQHGHGADWTKEVHTESESSMKEEFTIRLTSPMLYDRLHTLSAEYSVSVDLLVNEAVKRLIDDIDFVRSLRTGQAGGVCYSSACSK